MQEYPIFSKGAEGNELKYPMNQYHLRDLKYSRLVNPTLGKNHGYRVPDDFDAEQSTNEIIKVRMEVGRGMFPEWFMDKYYPFKREYGHYEFPKEIADIEGLAKDNPQGLADVVHMDSPADMPQMVLKWLTNKKYGQEQNVEKWTANHINFLETIPHVEYQISLGLKDSLDKAFEMKYFFGLARPEEVWQQKTGLEDTKLTAYEEGCPNHPSFPAGHASAAAGGLAALICQFPDLSPMQTKRILDMGYSWAMFRSLAGVHHAIDNIAGLMANGFSDYMKPEIVKKYTA